MSSVGISLSINVTEIEKGRLFKGKKGTYLDCTVFVDLDNPDQYGNNGMITQSLTKEERENGIKGKILGNCKVFWTGDGSGNSQAIKQQPQQSQQQVYQQQGQQQNQQQGSGFDDDIPF